jgi:hypothetical protein
MPKLFRIKKQIRNGKRERVENSLTFILVLGVGRKGKAIGGGAFSRPEIKGGLPGRGEFPITILFAIFKRIYKDPVSFLSPP